MRTDIYFKRQQEEKHLFYFFTWFIYVFIMYYYVLLFMYLFTWVFACTWDSRVCSMCYCARYVVCIYDIVLLWNVSLPRKSK
jgi:hypothetical protein